MLDFVVFNFKKTGNVFTVQRNVSQNRVGSFIHVYAYVHAWV
jgi:hypothetical protein